MLLQQKITLFHTGNWSNRNHQRFMSYLQNVGLFSITKANRRWITSANSFVNNWNQLCSDTCKIVSRTTFNFQVPTPVPNLNFLLSLIALSVNNWYRHNLIYLKDFCDAPLASWIVSTWKPTRRTTFTTDHKKRRHDINTCQTNENKYLLEQTVSHD